MQSYGVQGEKNILRWLTASVVCDAYLASNSDFLTSHQSLGLKPAAGDDLSPLFGNLVNYLTSPWLNCSSQENELLKAWIKTVFIKTGKISGKKIKNDEKIYPWKIRTHDDYKFCGLRYSLATKYLHFNPRFTASYQDLKTDHTFSWNLFQVAELAQRKKLFSVALATMTQADGEFPGIEISFRATAPQSIIAVIFSPITTVLTHYNVQSNALRPYFTYKKDSGETAVAPGYTGLDDQPGPESMTPPDQLAYTLADFYPPEI